MLTENNLGESIVAEGGFRFLGGHFHDVPKIHHFRERLLYSKGVDANKGGKFEPGEGGCCSQLSREVIFYFT